MRSKELLPNAVVQQSTRNDPLRLAELRRLLILDSTLERVYDDLTQLLATNLEVPISMLNMLDEERDWFKSSVGLPDREASAETSFCNIFFTSSEDLVVVEDATKDARFATHPFVVGAPFVRFYAAARLSVAGFTVGTLCVRDDKPRKMSTDQIRNIQMLANAVVELLKQRAGSNVTDLQFRELLLSVKANK